MDRAEMRNVLMEWRRDQYNSMGGLGEPAIELPSDKLLRFAGGRFLIRVDDLIDAIEATLPPPSKKAG